VGPNHNGSIKKAKKIINLLSSIDIDCVKFQLGNPEKIFSKNAFKANYQKNFLKKFSIKQISEKNQLSRADHLILAKYCRKKKLFYSCSAFDLESLKFLDNKINIPFFKIPSGEIFSLDMVKYISKKKKPIFISTGMTSLNQLKKILQIITKFGNRKIVIMHCVSSYPAEKNKLNLNIINVLKEKFKFHVGYSDHSIGEEACLAAVAKNVSVIEKHVTLSKKSIGPDHKSSMEIKDFKILVKKIRSLEKILGKTEKNFSKEEINVHKASRKSIVSARIICKGKKINFYDLCFKRPGTGINP
jgi:N,N'-diacetyllegionaminate synthase